MEADAEQAEQRIRSLSGRIEQTIDALLAEHTQRYGHLRSIVAPAVRNARPDRHEFALPLLVYGAERGDPAEAVPIAAVHALWWRAANLIDDFSDELADGGCAARAAGGGDNAAEAARTRQAATTLAAFNWAYVVPTRVLERLPVPEPVRRTLTAEFFRACTEATEGQLADMSTAPGDATHVQVLHTYRNKSSAPYAMAGAMAARAAGTGETRTEQWRSFGQQLGLLGQFRNDQDDLQSGRLQDLANRTPTLLLVALLDSAGEPERGRLLALLDRAPQEPAVREELLARMLEPALVRSHLAHVERARRAAEEILDGVAGDPECAGDPAFVGALRARVRAAATPCELLATAAGTGRPPAEPSGRTLSPR